MHQLLTANGPGRDPGHATVSKVMTAAEAVGRFVTPGATVGMGGQNINRCPTALAHEVVRQGIGDLTVVGCNLSLPVDLLAAAGQIRRTEQGSGNLERYGVLYTWRRKVERGEIEVKDYSHLSMATRFLGGAMGLPFMPTRSLLGSSVLDKHLGDGEVRLLDDPWGAGPVVLLQTLQPDVSLIHASLADTEGNVVIDGVTSHEIDMVRASRYTVVSVEEVVPAGTFGDRPESVTISGAYVSAVVAQPFGAYPTSVYRRYDYDDVEIRGYQEHAKAGDEQVAGWLQKNVLWAKDFEEYLTQRDPDGAVRRALAEQMRSVL
ncbi:CoA transferase subunit A [Streptomyces sp. NPDC020800]|uniref:CoA transferase subunit A n=1 Tax=Streptomyces sp. NPDC020800 TaxID=3365092 RepID=UPI0037B41E2D